MTDVEMIQNIPKFECSDGSPLGYEDDFFKDKLQEALTNRNIICLARGEGRSRVLNDIVFHPEILFDWGEKSLHAYLGKRDERLRRFCDPEVVDKELLIYYIRKYGDRLKSKYRKFQYLRCTENEVHSFEEQLIESVQRECDVSKLLCIKEWLFYALHTTQVGEFSRITPCISCCYGEDRFNIAGRFGRGHYNNYYVVMDCWVDVREEGNSYKNMSYVNEILGEYGLRWFSNRHNEIMLKYGIFPQQLVGYYFWDRENLTKYVINKHYVDEWNVNPDFQIGSPIYFEQVVDFDKLGPYNTVYEYDGRSYSIVGRRN